MSLLIHKLTSNQASFKQVHFTPGFNVILAERTKASTIKDSRNGLGKSTLIEIISFCLGGKLNNNLKNNLVGWDFTIDIEINNRRVIATRGTEAYSTIIIDGSTDFDIFVIQPKALSESNDFTLTVKEWNKNLGYLIFNLPIKTDRKYSPTFRSLFSYFIRSGKDAFASPFVNFRQQKECQKQVNNAFLLNLNWEYACQWQIIKDKKNGINNLFKAFESKIASDIFGTVGELQSLKVRLEKSIEAKEKSLKNYQVHEEYEKIQYEANKFSSEISELINENIISKKKLDSYCKSLEKESDYNAEDVINIYKQIEVDFSDAIVRRLKDVQSFHEQVVKNRKDFLQSEISQIEKSITERNKAIQEKTEAKAKLLKILDSHGALEEFTYLRQLFLEEVEKLNQVDTQLNRVKKLEDDKLNLEIEENKLKQKVLLDYNDRYPQISNAISIFNDNSESLYNAPGSLVIDVTDKGYKFDVDILRSRSEGISNMKIFCYDLLLVQLWSLFEKRLNFLVHDSTIFSGVDERQITLALELAEKKSQQYGFQYICMLNSDELNENDFSLNFNFNQYVRLKLTDESETGGLLGVRF